MLRKKLSCLLYIGTLWPEPNSSAGGVRTCQLLKSFSKISPRVVYASSAKQTPMSVTSFNGVETTTCHINRHDHFKELLEGIKPDVVVFDRFITEEQFGWQVHRVTPEALRVVETQDFHSLRKTREEVIKNGGDIEQSLKAVPSSEDPYLQRELSSMLRSDLTIVCSSHEKSLLTHHYKIPSNKVALASFFYPEPQNFQLSPSYEKRANFVTIGNFHHHPNVDSFCFLKDHIWPLIHKKIPNAEMHIYGAYPTKENFNLTNQRQNFFVKGPADTLDILQNYRVLLAPLRFGSGIKGKIADSWTHFTPLVTTPIGSEGMSEESLIDKDWDINQYCKPKNWGGLSSSTSPENFANDAIELYNNKELWLNSQANGIKLINELFNEEKNHNSLALALENSFYNMNENRKTDFLQHILLSQQYRATEYMSRWIELKETNKNKQNFEKN